MSKTPHIDTITRAAHKACEERDVQMLVGLVITLLRAVVLLCRFNDNRFLRIMDIASRQVEQITAQEEHEQSSN